MELPVFQNGLWIRYPIPKDIPLWSMSHTLQAASCYAAALQKGHTPEKSALLAECFINKQLYKDLHYNQSIEDLLRELLV